MAKLTLKFTLLLRCEKEGAKFLKLLTGCHNWSFQLSGFRTHPSLGYLMFQKDYGTQSTPFQVASYGSPANSFQKNFKGIRNITEHFPREGAVLRALSAVSHLISLHPHEGVIIPKKSKRGQLTCPRHGAHSWQSLGVRF